MTLKSRETLIIDTPEFSNRYHDVGTALDGMWYVRGGVNFVRPSAQKAILRMTVNKNCHFLLEPSDTSIGVSISSRNRAGKTLENAFRNNCIYMDMQNDMLDVICDTLAQESWWTADHTKGYVPDMTKVLPTEQLILGTDEEFVRLWNFSDQLTAEQIKEILTVFSRAFAFAGSNLFNQITDIIISKPKAQGSDTLGMAFYEQRTLWLNPALIAPGYTTDNDMQTLAGIIAHELGHLLLTDEALSDYAQSSLLSSAFVTEDYRKGVPVRKRKNLAGQRKNSVVSPYGLTSTTEEAAELFNLFINFPEMVRDRDGHDIGYLADSILFAMDELGYPLASDLSRRKLYWQRRIGERITYPLISVEPGQDFHMVVQYQDKAIKGVDYFTI